MADRLQRGTILPINHPFFSSLFQIADIFSYQENGWARWKVSRQHLCWSLSLGKNTVELLVVFCLTENLRSDKDKKNLSTDYRLTFVSLFLTSYPSLLLILNKEVINQWPLSLLDGTTTSFFLQTLKSSIQNSLCFTIVVFVLVFLERCTSVPPSFFISTIDLT